jgi:hypothetical protein
VTLGFRLLASRRFLLCPAGRCLARLFGLLLPHRLLVCRRARPLGGLLPLELLMLAEERRTLLLGLALSRRLAHACLLASSLFLAQPLSLPALRIVALALDTGSLFDCLALPLGLLPELLLGSLAIDACTLVSFSVELALIEPALTHRRVDSDSIALHAALRVYCAGRRALRCKARPLPVPIDGGSRSYVALGAHVKGARRGALHLLDG